MAQKKSGKKGAAKKSAAKAKKAAPAKKVAKKAAAKKPAAKATKTTPAKKAANKPAGRRAAAKKPAAKTATKKAAAKRPPAPARKAPAKASAKKAAVKAPARRAARRVAAAPAPPPPPPQREHVDRQQPESLRLRSITPALTVGDVQRSLAFYVDGLGFTVKEKWEREGQLQGAMLLAGDCELAIGQDDWAKGRDRVKGIGFRLYLDTTQDVDALGEKARAAGIEVEGPHDSSWGARLVGVTDPDGFKLTFQRYAKP